MDIYMFHLSAFSVKWLPLIHDYSQNLLCTYDRPGTEQGLC